MTTDEAALRPILISIPHASSIIPIEVQDVVQIQDRGLLEYVDLFSDEVYSISGYPIVRGEVCRVFVDVNRAPDDIAKEYQSGEEGVVVQMTQDGKPVYSKQPSDELVNMLIAKYHDPYHESIDAIMPKVEFLFDCHSYRSVGPPMKHDAGKPRPNFNIGNRSYSTCNRPHTIFVRDFFESHGFSVGINTPYMGGYVLAHHCHRRRIPPFLVPGMQIEISQSLYTDEAANAMIPDKVREMNQLIQEMVDAFYGEFCV